MTTAQVHRFRDKVAIYLPGGPTVYLSPKEARAISRLLRDCAKDVDARGFIESQFTSTEVELKP